MLNAPVLLITFNRPNHTRKVLERILEAHPKDLYVFQDGARDGNENDAVKCAEVRQVISELTGRGILNIGQITIHHTSYTIHFYGSVENLGCGAGPMTGISWFFDNVEQGIVMEDDCLAHPEFFGYCEELLNRYNDDDRVKFINSTLYDDRWTKSLEVEAKQRGGEPYSYGFSRYMVTGAWASWRSTWQGFDLDLKNLNACKFYKHVNKLTHNTAEAEWWWYEVRAIQKDNSKKSYWDYQMQIHLFQQNALTIHPAVNLISNIGFDAEGTHTHDNDGRGDRKVYSILPLIHPVMIAVDWRRDMICWAKKKSKGVLMDVMFEVYHFVVWRYKRRNNI